MSPEVDFWTNKTCVSSAKSSLSYQCTTNSTQHSQSFWFSFSPMPQYTAVCHFSCSTSLLHQQTNKQLGRISKKSVYTDINMYVGNAPTQCVTRPKIIRSDLIQMENTRERDVTLCLLFVATVIICQSVPTSLYVLVFIVTQIQNGASSSSFPEISLKLEGKSCFAKFWHKIDFTAFEISCNRFWG